MPSSRVLARALLLIAAAGCAARGGSRASGDAPVRVAERVVGYHLRRDPAAGRLGRGGLVVVVRALERPEEALAGASVAFAPRGPGARGQATDGAGVARFDSVAVGRHRLDIRRVGYGPAVVDVEVSPGCQERVEVYLPLHPICELGCPLSAPRAVATTCAPDV